MHNQVRIIAGKWRGRKLSFPDVPGLRPTPDRVRETVFNWLMDDITGARCLDLFAGSGALGFEALSRGAKEVVFVDAHARIVQQLQSHQKMLQCDNMQVQHMQAETYLKSTSKKFDIIFLDPPFGQNLIEPTCRLIADCNLLKPHAHIYIESEFSLKNLPIPSHWNIRKQKQSGQVQYTLLQIS